MTETMTAALTEGLGFLGTILNSITSNPVLCLLFVCGSIMPVAFKVFKMFKRSAR